MRDLNSVLLEGLVIAAKPRRGENGGIWVELKSRRNRETDTEVGSHRFRVEIKEGLRGCSLDAFTLGRRIRVVGDLRRESRLGSFIHAEFVEFKNAAAAVLM